MERETLQTLSEPMYYTLLDKFMKNELIFETKVEGRKRSYLIISKGRDMLKKEFNRLQVMVEEGSERIGGDRNEK